MPVKSGEIIKKKIRCIEIEATAAYRDSCSLSEIEAIALHSEIVKLE